MDYAEARAAFFAERPGDVRSLDWSSPARSLRDAIEPLATVCFWSEPSYDAYATLGLDFLQGYVYGRGCVLGEAEPSVVAAAFGVFEPGLVSDLFASGLQAVGIAEMREAKQRGAVAALRECIGEPDDLADVVAVLRRATEAADPTGRTLHAGLTALAWPDDLVGQLWHACSILREHRGDGHLAALVAAGVDGVQANQLTELWVGWEPAAYTGSRAWSPETMDAGLAALEQRGLVQAGGLTAAGVDLRQQLEQATDRSVQPVLDAIGDDLVRVVERLDAWATLVVERGWFPPDPFKRAAG